jgi:hypothetical protein
MNEQKPSWRLFLMPREPAWWIWLITASLLAAGLAGQSWGFVTAIGLSIAQTLFFLGRERSLKSSPVQTRLAYSVLLVVCFAPDMRWLYWLPTVGTFALVICGYCLMARCLSLLPWNRTEAITVDVLRHTFLAPPALGGVIEKSCPGGVCSIEAQLGERQ